MAKKDWKRFRSISYDEAGIKHWDANKGDSKVSVSRFYYTKPPKNWQVQITSVEQALKGYPNSKVGITKSEAMRKAQSYIKKHSK